MRTRMILLFTFQLLLMAGCSAGSPDIGHLASGPAANGTKGPALLLTGFETPDFSVGEPVDGVAGWVGFFNPQGTLISDSEPSSGVKCLRIDGADLELHPDFGYLSAYAGTELFFDPLAMGRPEVHCSADVRLDGPDTGLGPEADLLSANLVLLNPFGQAFGGYFISSNGMIYAFGRGGQQYMFATPQTPGSYAHLALDVDFSARKVYCSINGTQVGIMQLDPNNTLRSTELWTWVVELAAIDDLSLLDPADYTAGFDNLMVLAKPGNAAP